MSHTPTVLVTGGVRGLGRAIVERYLQAGHAVVTCSTSATSGEPLIDEIRAQYPDAKLGYLASDIGDAQQIARLYRFAVDRFGPPSIVINNAAVVTLRHTAETAPDDLEQALRVNVVGYWRLACMAYQDMKATGGGSIVNVASTHPFTTKPSSFPYNASKGAVLAMTKAMAVDFGPDGVRVNAVLPGIVMTRPAEKWIAGLPDPAAKRREMDAAHPMGRLPTERDVAEAVYFLTSPAAAGITGVDLVVDAGREIMRH